MINYYSLSVLNSILLNQFIVKKKYLVINCSIRIVDLSYDLGSGGKNKQISTHTVGMLGHRWRNLSVVPQSPFIFQHKLTGNLKHACNLSCTNSTVINAQHSSTYWRLEQNLKGLKLLPWTAWHPATVTTHTPGAGPLRRRNCFSSEQSTYPCRKVEGGDTVTLNTLSNR